MVFEQLLGCFPHPYDEQACYTYLTGCASLCETAGTTSYDPDYDCKVRTCNWYCCKYTYCNCQNIKKLDVQFNLMHIGIMILLLVIAMGGLLFCLCYCGRRLKKCCISKYCKETKQIVSIDINEDVDASDRERLIHSDNEDSCIVSVKKKE